MGDIDWTAVAAFVAAFVAIANIVVTARLSRRRLSESWAREQLPKLLEEFWEAADTMESELEVLRDADDLQALDEPHMVGMKGFAGMAATLEKMELGAPAKIAYRAAVYMDTLGMVKIELLETSSKEERTRVYWQLSSRLAARQELLNAGRAGMGLDRHSIAKLNRERARAVSVHPRIERKHEKALARLHRVQRRGERWWVR